MIKLSKIKLPDAVEVEGSFYSIKTDFRTWLGFGEILKSEKISPIEYALMFNNENKIPDISKGLSALIEFYNPPRPLPRPSSNDSHTKVMDYELDGDLIYSAFFEQYGIDLLATDKNGRAVYNFHWHQFLALLAGLHNTRLDEVIGIRSYNPQDKSSYADTMKRLKASWELPRDNNISESQREFEALLNPKK